MLDEEVVELSEDSNYDPDEELRMQKAFAKLQEDDSGNSRGRFKTIKDRTSGSQPLSDNQSMIADLAEDCETKRINNDNYRLDMTWADLESQKV